MAIVSREMDAYFAKLRETIPPENFFWVIYGPRLRYAWIHTAAPTQPATAVGEDGPESEDDHACGHGYPRQYRHDCPECSRCQHALKAMGKKWKALCEECGEGPCKRAAHPTPPTLHTAPDAGEVEVVAWMNASGSTIKDAARQRMIADGQYGGEFKIGAGMAERHNTPLVRKSDYDRLRGALNVVQQSHQWVNRKREAAEAARDAAVGVLREARRYVARIDTLLTEASREG